MLFLIAFTLHSLKLAHAYMQPVAHVNIRIPTFGISLARDAMINAHINIATDKIWNCLLMSLIYEIERGWTESDEVLRGGYAFIN